MTFACLVQTLRDDYHIWKKYCAGLHIPNDFHAFVSISQNDIAGFLAQFRCKKIWVKIFKIIFKNRITGKRIKKVVSPIPAYATHTDMAYLAPFIDWENVK
jgi:hypothetical protein